MNPPVVGTVVVVDSTVEVVVKLEEASFAVVVSNDVETELGVENEETENVVVKSNQFDRILNKLKLQWKFI